MGRKRLTTLEDCRRYLARIVNDVEDGELDPKIAGRLGYLISILKSCIESGEIEKRLQELEEKALLRFN